jgi:hypothetical protein
MWIQKLAYGVLQVDTPIGPRYIRPDLFERASLLWTFRNFNSLPQQVLSTREQRMIDRLCGEHRFVPMGAHSEQDKPVIGRIERRTPAQPDLRPARGAVASVESALPEHGREAASA